MAKRNEPPRAHVAAVSPLTSSPFAALAGLHDEVADGEPAIPRDEATPVIATRGPARAIVRYERAGRGGKEVTIVERLGLSAEQADVWCSEIKRALGCGGSVTGDHLVFAGDQRRRLPTLLEGRGVRRVTVS
jgi:translation initiation factor 1